MTKPVLSGLACSRCSTTASDDAAAAGCHACSAQGYPANLTTVYDLTRVARLLDPAVLRWRRFDMWRYQELLPVASERAVTLGEGGTPLLPAPRLAERLGLRQLWIKDETRNPTWSFKDRAAAVSASMAKATGTWALVVSSTGNAGAATAAYARRAGLSAVVLFTCDVDPLMKSLVLAYRPHAVATPTKADRWLLMQHCVAALGCYPNSNFQAPPIGNNPYAIDGYKTIGFEIWEQLDHYAPDWIFVPTGYGDGLFGIYKGFSELAELGLADVPRLGAGEVSGSLARTVPGTGDRPFHGNDITGTLGYSISNPQGTYQAVAALRRSKGTATTITNDELTEWRRLLASMEGLFVETSSAAGFAALARQLDAGVVHPDERVVVVATSSGLKSIASTNDRQVAVPVATSHAELEDVLRRVYGQQIASIG